MEQLIAYIGKRIPVSIELKETIKTVFKKERFAKQALLLKEFQPVRKLYFINKGIFRTYYVHDGKEVTSWFYDEHQFLTSWHGFYKQEFSYEYIEALEDSVVFSIEYQAYLKLINTHQKFERFSRLLAEDQLAFIDSYSKGYMFMSAKDKYDLLLVNNPNIELRVKLGYIASFLGISQETLSRIRSRK